MSRRPRREINTFAVQEPPPTETSRRRGVPRQCSAKEIKRQLSLGEVILDRRQQMGLLDIKPVSSQVHGTEPVRGSLLAQLYRRKTPKNRPYGLLPGGAGDKYFPPGATDDTTEMVRIVIAVSAP
ncbi:MAG: hypothetical protein GPOALKHO_001379 [Sodalis sp.]|uniref:hypothetical protein n=1 Tax=Sodalis sp. (in: enterobacteria) TaxID=1898979 RepID=UPI003872F64A|nr:MAG: hypothetical protein GPOALKHO_001379 [Sodalis sp.]